MADIRCLICDHVNDASAERCWYCQALLRGKPAISMQEDKPDPHMETPELSVEATGENGTPKNANDLQLVEEVPDWLARIRKLKEQEGGASEPESEEPAADEEIPIWLKSLRGIDSDSLEIEPVENPLKDEEESQVATPFQAAEGEISEQLESLSGEAVADGGVLASVFNEDISRDGRSLVKNVINKPGESDTPFEAVTTEPEDTPVAEPDLPIFVDDLPEWLSSEKDVIEKIASPPPSHQEKPSAPAGGKIERGMLPAWLKAIRPLDAVAPAVNAGNLQVPVEEHGILAGIEGTLRAVDLTSQENRPASNQQELHVTPAQLRNAELFHSLLQAEPPTSVVKTTGQIPPGRNKQFRIIIAVVLLLAIFIPFLLRSITAIIPVLYSQEVVDTLSFIEELPADKPVMVAAQFEAGLAGELAWAAEPVIEHLVSHGVPMALTSTNVTGYAILQEQLNRAAENATNYPVDEKVVNLGYLPGGTIGLISLVSDLQQTLPFSTELTPAWELPAIANVNTLSEFSAVLILTDNPEIARAWVEQAGRAVSPPPLMAVVSAQAAPLVQPYYDSGQIKGYIAGISGALTYELIRQVPGKASSTYSSYQLAILTAALLVFIGGMVTLILSSGADTKKKGGS